MGDLRFRRALARVQDGVERADLLRAMATDDLIMALAASSPERDPLLVNVLATELQNRARRSLAVAENVAEAILLVLTDGTIAYANPAAARMIGRDDRELIGLHVADLRLLDRHGEPLAWEERPLRRALEGKTQAERGDLLFDADGGRVPVAVLAAPVWADGDLIGAVATMRDVTQQRALEEHLLLHKLLLDAVGEALVATRPDGAILYWNRAAEELYGWRQEEVLGRPITEVTPAETSREQAEEIMRSLQRMEPWSGRFPVRRKDGSTFLAHVTNRAVLDGAGRLVAIVGVSHADRSGDPFARDEGRSNP